MQRVLLVLLFSGACLAAEQAGDDAVKMEMKKFQGKWEATGGQNIDGTIPTDVELQLTSMEIDGDQFTMKTGSLTVKGTFTVDPTKKPKTIDVFFGDAKDKPFVGVYVIEGETRKSCFSEPGKDRPNGVRKEKGYLYLEWKRAS